MARSSARVHCSASLPLCLSASITQLLPKCSTSCPGKPITRSGQIFHPNIIKIFVFKKFQLLKYLVCIFAGNWTFLSSAEHHQKSNYIVLCEYQIQICPCFMLFHALRYFNRKHVQLLQILLLWRRCKDVAFLPLLHSRGWPNLFLL